MAHPRIVVISVGAFLLLSEAAGALDLTGKWRLGLEDFGSPIVEVTQTGSDVSFDMWFGQLSGTVTTGGDFATYSVSGTTFFGSASLAGRIMPSGNLLDGRMVSGSSFGGGVAVGWDFATRCTCDDGNTVDGDGCSAECQVEPCWECSGDPSVCTPLADGSPCEDGSVCTTGETCSAGVCGGGAPVSPCIDMTGLWNVSGSVEAGFFGAAPYTGPYEGPAEVVQRGTDLYFFGAFPRVRKVGTIDPATGAFDVRVVNTDPEHLFCFFFDTLTGVVDSSGLTYTGGGAAGVIEVGAADQCRPQSWSETGTRCGSGTLEPGEECDDGNLSDGDGCSAGCTVEPCWECSGEPSSCAPAPRSPCKSSSEPHKSAVILKKTGEVAKDRLVWRWKKGEDTALAELGDPVGGDDFALCIFDESSPAPALAFRAEVPGGGTCDGKPCWKAAGSKGFVNRSKLGADEGVTRMRLRSGTGGGAGVLLRGQGEHLSDRPFGLPAPPLGTPLRVQLHGPNDLCIETLHDGAAVLRNDPDKGLFKARGIP